ncbi:M48 family metallopeptidase [Thiomicrorhabdus lithotrophica]|uniref:M48 family metallopeptidase n=1 Tax=Thiomicrorhabdus lithotrophica TaxID=2949997 RepID=A0ABY8CBL3_9GAMM|nr:SprT family zinc-dependent metalloprotease [Thiomicrorhabdus lithotrophica]WEJ62070.1 M48 family metallopeptidase [Thiomicrorhabdus lithotrophica]
MFNMRLPSFTATEDFPKSYQVGEHTLPLVLSARRKSIAIKQRKGGFVLEVPHKISAKQLQSVLMQNHNWLLKRVAQLVENALPKFNGVEGETFEFLGEQKTLSWQFSEGVEQNGFHIDAGLNRIVFHFPIHQKELECRHYCCQSLEQFFKQTAQDYLKPKLDFYAEQMGVSYRSLTVKGYKSRWGSCYSDGRIQFNWRLMQAPKWVIDYVVVHELAHLVHANHSKDFWELVELHYPKTKQAKQVIRQHGRNWIDFLQF